VDLLEVVGVFNDSSQYTCKVREGGIWWLFLSLETEGFWLQGYYLISQMQAAELKPFFHKIFVVCVPGTHGNPLIGWCTWSLFSGVDVYQSNCLGFGPLPIFILRLFVHYMVSRRGMLLLLPSWYGEIQSFCANALNCN
jgi:hypothetical protein